LKARNQAIKNRKETTIRMEMPVAVP